MAEPLNDNETQSLIDEVMDAEDWGRATIIRWMINNGWRSQHGLVFNDEIPVSFGDNGFKTWGDALKACIEVASGN